FQIWWRLIFPDRHDGGQESSLELSTEHPPHPQAISVIPDVWRVHAAAGGAKGQRTPAPRTAASYPSDAGSGYPSRAIRWSSHVIVMPAILQPLPHVPMHIVKPESVRQETPDRRSIGVAVAAWHDCPGLRAVDLASRRQIGAVAVAAKILLPIAEEI